MLLACSELVGMVGWMAALVPCLALVVVKEGMVASATCSPLSGFVGEWAAQMRRPTKMEGVSVP